MRSPFLRQRQFTFAQTSLIKDLIHKAFSGSGKDLVLAALRGHVTQQEREQIQAILDRDK
ncbi:hypothetical protein [Massilia sp. TWR1-2-2]|uniref:hypothetical protein n=1 Tax=Massilia sp. TWR1-2-2 TaxID=2804584 RepID=UPI003CF8B767